MLAQLGELAVAEGDWRWDHLASRPGRVLRQSGRVPARLLDSRRAVVGEEGTRGRHSGSRHEAVQVLRRLPPQQVDTASSVAHEREAADQQ